ncbi:MAG: DUF2892 domain-containing protein [Proteobacteria bacterium]|nr:DUF2892 domain-containing protein [Pseudomonadota bacterium]
MKTNVGGLDRILRMFLGLILIAFAIPIGFAQTGYNWIGWIGIIPLATAIFRFCPAYLPFGISSCARE